MDLEGHKRITGLLGDDLARSGRTLGQSAYIDDEVVEFIAGLFKATLPNTHYNLVSYIVGGVKKGGGLAALEQLAAQSQYEGSKELRLMIEDWNKGK